MYFRFGWIFINLYGVALIIFKWDYDLYICAAEEDTHIFIDKDWVGKR